MAMAEAVKADATGVADSGILLPLIFTLLAQVLVAVIRWRQRRPPAPAEPTKELSSRAVGVQVAALATSELDRQTAVALRALRSGLREAHILDLPPRYDDEELYRFLCAAKPPSGESGRVATAIEMVQADLRWRAARPASRGPTEEASAAIFGRVMLRGLDLRGRPCMVIRLDSEAFSKPELFVEELLLALEEHFAGVWRLGGALLARPTPLRPAPPLPSPPCSVPPRPAPPCKRGVTEMLLGLVLSPLARRRPLLRRGHPRPAAAAAAQRAAARGRPAARRDARAGAHAEGALPAARRRHPRGQHAARAALGARCDLLGARLAHRAQGARARLGRARALATLPPLAAPR